MSGEQIQERRRIGRYEVIAEVGRGGMGVVYRAQDRMIGRDVAIKTLTDVTPELRERFYVEARSGILSHPNIVTVYELGEEDGTPFIAMEFLAGESLERLLKGKKRLPLLEALPITEQMCAGLGYAHQHGLIHRDVKPANVMVQPDGRVKIVDFGIARLTDRVTRLTRADSLLGTFHYIAPERLKGEASDGRADIWSVGVMLYEMVTGELPFRGKDMSALYQVMHEPYVPLHEFVERVPEALTGVLDRALAKSVNERYGSTEEMLVDLQKVGDELKQGRVEELLESARRLMQERRYANARTVVLQVQRIDVGNVSARLLLQKVQEELSHLQRGEQLRQIVEQAEEAVASRQMDDALTLYEQAAKLDQEGTFDVGRKMEELRGSIEQARRVRSLWEQAGEARGRGDLTQAKSLLAEALEIDDRSTELRQAHAILLREIRRKEETAKIDELLRGAREEISVRQYTAAMARLRHAAELDPTREEVQELLLTTAARQREEHRRQVLDQIVGEIQESLNTENLERARDQITRALDTLPTETALLRLKAEVNRREREVEVEALVRATALESQRLWEEEPEHALTVVQGALAKEQGEPRLVQMRGRLEEYLQQREKQRLRESRVGLARQWLEQGRPADAVIELEAAAIEVGETEELTNLLTLAREQQEALQEKREKSARVEAAQRLLREGRYPELLSQFSPGSRDSEIEDLREIAERRIRESAERVQAVMSRAMATAEMDLQGALRLLGEQPEEVKRSASIVALCAELTRRAAKEQTIAAAAQRSDALLQQGNLAGSRKPINQAAREFGARDPAVVAARKVFEERRRAAADDALQSVLRGANQALAAGAVRDAQRALGRGRVAAGFASGTVQEDLRRLEQRAAKERAQKQVTTAAVWRRAQLIGQRLMSAGQARHGFAITIDAGRWRRWSAAALVATVLGGGVTLAVHKRKGVDQQPAAPPKTVAVVVPTPSEGAQKAAPSGSSYAPNSTPPVATPAKEESTFLTLDASPWATVIAVRDQSGNEITLPSGGEAVTPLRVNGLPTGTYRVELQNSEGEHKEVDCGVSAAQHLCVADFGEPSVSQLLKGAR